MCQKLLWLDQTYLNLYFQSFKLKKLQESFVTFDFVESGDLWLN